MAILKPTGDLGGELADHWGAEAFNGGRSYCEGVGGAGVEVGEDLAGLVSEFKHFAALIGQVKLCIKGAQSFVGDLRSKGAWVMESVVYLQAARRPVMVTWFPAYLIAADDTVGLQRFPPAQTNLLLIAAAHDGIHWDGTRD